MGANRAFVDIKLQVNAMKIWWNEK
jgi:hypothetical protein